ncbi:hypothetical protein [Corynebacterium sp. HMSC29G08]|uniref:hypothetical protein n=1 Tax=Corynebacterium sp. HMSC29G08 TaxID=1581069 RepID=UPI0008A537EE|nr:hypothetical protein [Corynebacterium sp. HMSC29G08]OFT82022.1 hypothetical protein HMPREF3101_08705 [Corynebacterium sp. HMSC29G08]
MRKILASSLAAAVIFTGSTAVSAVAAEGDTPSSSDKTNKQDAQSSAEKAGSTRDDSKNVPLRPTLGAPSPGLEKLNPDPYTDPMYIDPDKNPFKKVSSSDMFMDWTKDMPEGEGKDFVQAWAVGSAVPDTANPVELLKQELQGSSMMSSGMFTGDWAQSSRGSSQATSVIIPVLLGLLVIGQVTELVMRGLRHAGVEIPAFTF